MKTLRKICYIKYGFHPCSESARKYDVLRHRYPQNWIVDIIKFMGIFIYKIFVETNFDLIFSSFIV